MDDRAPAYLRAWAEEWAAHESAGARPAAQAVRDRIFAAGYTVTRTSHGPAVVPRPRWTAMSPADVPDHRREPDRCALSVCVLLDDLSAHPAPPRPVAPQPAASGSPRDTATPATPPPVQAARRCLAALLPRLEERAAEVLVLDNGMGGAAGDWAAVSSRNPAITALHLAERVPAAAARALQHRTARGRVVLWLGTELSGPLEPLLAAVDGGTDAVCGSPAWRRTAAGAFAPVAEASDCDVVGPEVLAVRRAVALAHEDPVGRDDRHAAADLCLGLADRAAVRGAALAVSAATAGHEPWTPDDPAFLARWPGA